MVAVDAVIIEVLSCTNASMRYRTQRAVGLPDVVVVCSHNAKRRKADRLAFAVTSDIAPALSYPRSLQVGCRG
jgi:hypothetical protein